MGVLAALVARVRSTFDATGASPDAVVSSTFNQGSATVSQSKANYRYET
jgi:hypothetical protein